MPDDLFPATEHSFKSKLQSAVQRLASSNIFVGTSSWKYEGWCGQIYDEQRYHYRGKFAETRFKRDCLTEYAEVFKTVCVDAAYYQFPSAKYLSGLVEKVPGDFLFTFKVRNVKTASPAGETPRWSRVHAHRLAATIRPATPHSLPIQLRKMLSPAHPARMLREGWASRVADS